jgi:predicted RecA/RadA family phage recombinase
MAKNYLQPGVTLTVTAPYAVASGAGVLVGRIFGVAQAAALISTPVEIVTEGVFTLAKANEQAWTVGAAIYWDDTAKVATTVGAASNVFIGSAVEAVADTAGLVTGKVLLQKGIRRAAHVANASSGSAAEINAIRDALVAAGLMAHA